MSDVIADALAAHADSGSTSMDSLGNTVVSMDSPVETDSAVDSGDVSASSAAGDAPVESAVDPAAQAPVELAVQDEVDKLLASEGIQKDSIRGENRIPYSRTKKIIENAQKAWQATADAKYQPLQQQVEQTQSQLAAYRNQEQLASTDPDRFIAALAAVDSRYAKFLAGGQQQGTPTPPKDADPEPQPSKDEAGALYYTPEQWKDHQAWTRRQAVKEAQAAFEQKYGPVLSKQVQREEAAAAYEARVPVVQAQMKRLNDTYGAEMVKKNEGAIVQAMQAAERRGEHLSPSEAAAMVLIPLIRTDEATTRKKVLDEINGRAAAAKGQAPAHTRSEPLVPANASVEALIKGELDRVLPNRNR